MIMTLIVLTLSWLSHVTNSLEHSLIFPDLTFLGNEHSRSLQALDDNTELDSFTDVASDETTESKAKESKIKTEVEEKYLLTDCQLILLII